MFTYGCYFKNLVRTSDVMIIEIDIEIAIFRKIEQNRYRDFLEQVYLDSNTVSPLRDRRSAHEVTEWEWVLHHMSWITYSVPEFISL